MYKFNITVVIGLFKKIKIKIYGCFNMSTNQEIKYFLFTDTFKQRKFPMLFSIGNLIHSDTLQSIRNYRCFSALEIFYAEKC